MSKIIINNKAGLLDSKAMGFVSDVIHQPLIENVAYPKYSEFNIDNKQYSIFYKKGKDSHIFTIEYTGYEHQTV